MRKVFGVLLVLLALYLAHQGWLGYTAFRSHHSARQEDSPGNPADPANLPGLPAQLEPLLQAAQKQGPKTMKKWLDYYGSQLEDPRKAWIQLDYVLAVSSEDMVEARQVFAEVKARVPKSSPVYARVKRLEKAYE